MTTCIKYSDYKYVYIAATYLLLDFFLQLALFLLHDVLREFYALELLGWQNMER